MNTFTHTSFAVVTAVGAIRKTYDTKAGAIAHAIEHGDQFPGLRVEEITVSERRRVIWTPRHQLVGSVGQ